MSTVKSDRTKKKIEKVDSNRIESGVKTYKDEQSGIHSNEDDKSRVEASDVKIDSRAEMYIKPIRAEWNRVKPNGFEQRR